MPPLAQPQKATVRVWGCRGSIPVPGPGTLRHGGNTSCVEVRTPNGSRLILDAGTGIRALGSTIPDNEGATLFITHPHWDHIQGFPFFPPFWFTDNSFVVYGRPNVLEALKLQMSAPSFPLEIKDLKAKIELRELPIQGLGWVGVTGYDFAFDTFPAAHPNDAQGFKVQLSGGAEGIKGDDNVRAAVYIPDNELARPEAYQMGPNWRQQLVNFVKGAKVLIHDAAYTPEEYSKRRGWGHSSDEDAVQLALDAEVETLVLFHHAPERTDDEMDRVVERCQKLASARSGRGEQSGLKVVAAAEGMEFEIN